MNSPATKITVLEVQMKEIKNETKEIKKDLNHLREENTKGFDRLEKKLDCYVTKIQYNTEIQGIKESVNKGSSNWDWVVKTVMGLVIGALLAIIFKT